ncbi:MAG: hypothetical protein J4432_01315 [DPANN group archaeon]|nr:hypothetical protein [DPANN group archaeon]
MARDERDIQNKGLDKVIRMVDYKLINNGTIETLHCDIELLFEELEKEEITLGDLTDVGVNWFKPVNVAKTA